MHPVTSSAQSAALSPTSALVPQELMQHKLVFIETQDVVETTLALDNFRRACDCGRGAVFFRSGACGCLARQGTKLRPSEPQPVVLASALLGRAATCSSDLTPLHELQRGSWQGGRGHRL